ncbi:FecR protein [Duganella sacchari]|uniref:FecR protein n=1 Tax=Duganella sacchari TaxID=551987 RepID=A0A1M7R900_9BURK|nr:FecR family protein [Duganella sacchari]SHN42620.1 FecR protein [Duganella sacchari]
MWSQLSPNNLLRHWQGFALGAAMLVGANAYAGEAGRIVFVTGEVYADSRRAALNDAVQEGQELSTGKDGYVYLKTADDGLLILRPASRARIVAYHVDRQVPSNTHVKLELLSGVARSVSGTAVKQARQNFRFNTPVAAIGVRGTDFTVFTDQESSSVTVLSGAIVVSGFGGACLPTGGGPCEHTASRELAAGQTGQMLKVKRGETAPQLLNNSSSAPDAVSPPRTDEPSGKSGNGQALSEPSLDAQKAALVLQQVRNSITKNSNNTSEQPTVTVPPPEVVTPPTVVVPTEPPSQLVWGRWAAVADQAPLIDSAALLAAGGKRVAYNSYYTIIRTKGADWEVPQQGSMGFALRASDAFVMDSATQTATPATLQNGQLQVDFGKRTFSTGFDLLNAGQTYKLQSTGFVGGTGELSGNIQYVGGTNMSVSGALGAANNAAYIFSSRLDEKRVANGVTYWTK